MNATLTIARRQFASYFNGPVAYIVMAVFALLLGVFFWPPFFLMGRATVRDMFNLIPILLLLAAPAITMGLLAEEKRSGTIELLITMPIRDRDVILGKYLGVMGLFIVLLLLTLPFPLSISNPFSATPLGNLDWGPVWTGYLGLLLQGGAMLAIGLLASSLTDNQLIAFFVSAAACFAFWIIDRFLPFLPTSIASIVEWFSFDYHFRSLGRGVVDSRDVIFFLSIIGYSLGLSFLALESRRWS